jgi:Glycosyltransferase family 87
VWRTTGRLLLTAWFAVLGLGIARYLLSIGWMGGDFRIYYRAMEAWLGGGDPWAAGVAFRAAHFGAPPASLLPLAPFALLSEGQAVAVWEGICVLAALAIVRSLRLGPEWLLFPPLVDGVVSGNPSIPLLALLLAGAPWASGLAVALKSYAIVPLLGERRWKGVAISLIVLLASVVIAPGLWLEYMRRFGDISARLTLESQGGYSAFYWFPLVIPTVIALLVIARYDLRAAGWLAVPALWPASEWHWSTLAMPVMTPWLAIPLALDLHAVPALVTWPYAVVVWYRARHPGLLGARLRLVRSAVARSTPWSWD